MGICCSSERSRLHITPGKTLQQSEIISITKLDSKDQLDILNHYKFTRVCGYGQFGTVREAVKLNPAEESKGPTNSLTIDSMPHHNRKYAIKSIMKSNVREKFDMLKQEIETLRISDHPNIVRLYSLYEDDKYLHIVMELCTGGDLVDYMLNNGPLPEQKAAQIMQKLMQAVAHLHNLNICHRDLKPENILFVSSNPDAEIKLVDFGVAAKFSNQHLQDITGTPLYIAPEVIKGKHGKECDIWSLGIIMYFLLSESHPFGGKTMEELFRNIIRCDFSFEDKPNSNMSWTQISSGAKHLISLMLVAKPTNRISLSDALKHSWFQKQLHKRQHPITGTIVRNISDYRVGSKLRREIMNFMIRNMSETDLSGLNDLFKQFDTNNSGYISTQDIINALTASNLNFDQVDMQSNCHIETISKLGRLRNTKLNYTDFLALVMNTRKLVDEENLWVAFKLFDENNDGTITLEEFKQSIEIAGGFITEKDMNDIMHEFQLRTDQAMGFEQFKEIMHCKIYSDFVEEETPIDSVPATPHSRQRGRQSSKRLTWKGVLRATNN